MSTQIRDYSNELTEKTADLAKCFKVTKSNEFIRDSKFDLSLTEQRIVFYLIASVEPDDTMFRECVFDIDVFCKMCGLQKKGSTEHLKSVLKNLRDKSVWIDTPNGKHINFSWFSCVEIDDVTKKITLEISDRMRPYLLELKSNFTTYKLGEVIRFKSKYSAWFYDNIMCQYGIKKHKPGEWEVDIDVIREKNFYNSGNFKDIRRRIIEPALKDINSFTSIEVDYGIRKKGNKVVSVIFSFKEKPVLEEIVV